MNRIGPDRNHLFCHRNEYGGHRMTFFLGEGRDPLRVLRNLPTQMRGRVPKSLEYGRLQSPTRLVNS